MSQHHAGQQQSGHSVFYPPTSCWLLSSWCMTPLTVAASAATSSWAAPMTSSPKSSKLEGWRPTPLLLFFLLACTGPVLPWQLALLHKRNTAEAGTPTKPEHARQHALQAVVLLPWGKTAAYHLPVT